MFTGKGMNQAVLVAVGAFTLATQVSATGGVEQLHLGAGSRVWIEGDSTLHRFKAEASVVKGDVTTDGSASGDIAALVRGGSIRIAVLTVPAAKLTSGESGLDKNMWKALKTDRQPDIVFEMRSVSAAPGDTSFGVKLHGRLSVAGVTRDVDVDGQATRSPEGLRIAGSVPLLMSEYGIAPPVLMAGLIRVKDNIVVRFDVVVRGSAL